MITSNGCWRGRRNGRRRCASLRKRLRPFRPLGRTVHQSRHTRAGSCAGWPGGCWRVACCLSSGADWSHPCPPPAPVRWRGSICWARSRRSCGTCTAGSAARRGQPGLVWTAESCCPAVRCPWAGWAGWRRFLCRGSPGLQSGPFQPPLLLSSLVKRWSTCVVRPRQDRLRTHSRLACGAAWPLWRQIGADLDARRREIRTRGWSVPSGMCSSCACSHWT